MSLESKQTDHMAVDLEGTSLDCIACGTAMHKREYEGVTIDECDRCGSVWLDRGDLGPILDTREVRFTIAERAEYFNRLRSGIRRGDTPSRPCPVCGVEMQVFNYGGNSGVFLDRCPDRHGLWLDPGELENIQIAMEGPPPGIGVDGDATQGGATPLTHPKQRACPDCAATLEEAELGDIPLDWCTQCGGVWCDGNELTRLFFAWQEHACSGQAAAANQAASPGEDNADGRRPVCVICQAPLERFNFQYTSGVYVDNCPNGHGTWLDAERIAQVRAYAHGLCETGNETEDRHTHSLGEGELRRCRRTSKPRALGAFTTFLQLFGLCTES